MEVPIFKQFHKNVIGRGGSTIKKVTMFLYMFETTGLQISINFIEIHVVVKKKSITKHQIEWDSATCITYSVDYYQRLTLES